MNEYDRELLNEFVVESSELLEQVEGILLGIDDAGGDLDPDMINQIFRAVHSVKGTSGFFGLEVIGSLSHIMENVLGEMREGRLSPTQELINLLLSSNDRLRALVADPEASQSEDVRDSVAALEVFLEGGGSEAEPAEATAEPAEADVAGEGEVVDEGPLAITPAVVAEVRRHGQHLYRLELSLARDISGRKRSLDAFFTHLESVGKVVGVHPSRPELAEADPGSRTPFTVLLATVLDPGLAPMGLALAPDRIHVVDVRTNKALPEASKAERAASPKTEEAPEAEASKPAAEAEASKPAAEASPDKAPPKKPEGKRAPSKLDGKRSSAGQSDSLRVKTSLLDRLMQMAGELVLARNRLLRRLEGERDRLEGIGPILSELNGITSEMQEQIMQTRLQPLGSIFGRFSRVVHDMSQKLGKSVRLETVGGDVELDKTLLEGLTDPLTHMLRNSIDHGLEGPDDRERLGKARQGVVTIHAYHEGGMVNIDVKDDGRGIDVERVKLTAVKRGVLTSDQAARMSDADAIMLIFKPGFSTAAKVTDVSGRGVGMDVVRTNIEKLGGVVEASTRLGKGSCVSIKIPLTLAIVTSLIVEVEGQRFALPQVGLESVVRLKPEEIPDRVERIRDMDVLRYRERLLPIVRLSDVLGIERTYVDPKTGEVRKDRRGRISDRRAFRNQEGPPEGQGEARAQRSDRRQALQNVLRILVLRVGRNSYGLVVDRIVENEEIVVKPLSRFLRECSTFSGATILGDGTIAMILDPVNIANKANLKFSDLARDAAEESLAERRNALRERVPLIHFTNGGQETFAMPLAQVSRVEKISRAEIQRVGHKEYINYRGQALPLVRLHDYLDVGMAAEEPDEIKVIIPRLNGEHAGIVTHEVIDARDVDLTVDESTIRGQGLIGSAIFGDDIVLVIDTYGLVAAAGIGDDDHAVARLAGRRALVVEDTPFLRRVTQRYLEQVGLEVHAVEDGAEAWEAMQDSEYDVVITDLRMPELDGAGLLSRIRAHSETRHTPVIALAEEPEDERQFDAYAQKLDRPELVAALVELLAHLEEEAAA